MIAGHSVGLQVYTPMATDSPEKSLECDAIWKGHLAALDETRRIWLESPWAMDEQERARTSFQVLTALHSAFNIGISPRQNFPFFDKHPFHHPIAYSWGLCCPDFHYRHAFVDGARSYRIHGRRGAGHWSEFHLMAGFWGDPDYVQLGAWDLANFETAPDGSFDIIMSATRHEGNWIELDPGKSNYMVVVRDVIYDWEKDEPTALSIEALSDEPLDIGYIGEAELYRRIDKASTFILTSAKHWVARAKEIVAAVGFNRFWEGREANLGGIQHAGYHFMVFSIERDEALVIEVDIPEKAKFWGIQLADLCQQTLDHLNHQSSLNAFQTQVDSDGKARFVLSLADPGIPNWLDTAGVKRGIAAWRWVGTDPVPHSTVKKTNLSDVRQHLHRGTPAVSAEQRQAVIARRRAGIKRLYAL